MIEMQALLGIDAKSAAGAAKVARSSKKVRGALDSKTAVATFDDAAASRILKYRLQRGAQKLLPNDRVHKCHRLVNSTSEHNLGVDLAINKETGRATFANVQTCGSVWHCPVCAAKISEGRRAELQAAMVTHVAKGGSVLMMTLTYPHTLDLPLEESVKAQSKALRTFKADRQYKNLMKEIGAIGSIRSLEVTHGQNGWHPHTHDLIFINNQDPVHQEKLEKLRDIWGKHVFKAGLGHINEHGFKVNDGQYAAEYIAKFGRESKGWNASSELTKSHIKKGRNGSRTPFDLLRDYLAGSDSSGALFVEYAEVFKGKRQLYYTPGLKEKLGIDDVSDEDLAAETLQEKERIGTLDREEWKLILRTNSRGEVLHFAEIGGMASVRQYLERIKHYRASDDHYYWEDRKFQPAIF